MNIKKVIALSILILANIVMLAKPVVCYYQHTNQTPAAECAAKQKNDCCKHNKQDNSPDKNTPQKDFGTHKCVLKNLFLQENSNKIPKLVANDFNTITGNIPDCQTALTTDLTGLSFRQKPYIPIFYADFVSHSIGLRAPPAC
ncbi:MAG: hypothetical protein LBR45_04115 [Bacteroidales bacterium]|jgi:hypothetical protein|nr:hypothetical protein [Bacteroidales bacterium]